MSKQCALSVELGQTDHRDFIAGFIFIQPDLFLLSPRNLYSQYNQSHFFRPSIDLIPSLWMNEWNQFKLDSFQIHIFSYLHILCLCNHLKIWYRMAMICHQIDIIIIFRPTFNWTILALFFLRFRSMRGQRFCFMISVFMSSIIWIGKKFHHLKAIKKRIEWKFSMSACTMYQHIIQIKASKCYMLQFNLKS